MKILLILEEAAMFGFSIFLFQQTSFEWWWYPALILLPDIGMLGYLVNSKTGAVTYNLFHHKAVAVAVLCAGSAYDLPWVVLSGIILFGHASMDRVFGYGLKYSDSFFHTHLGWMKPAEMKSEK
ncbi:MAG: DUF4260 domain-containing protein [Flavobacteriales bacterium]